MDAPTFRDVLRAQERIAQYLRPTPLFNYPALDRLIETRVFIKHENCQPVGAFKVRGGINVISQLCEEEKEAGVIGASTGNHGQSIAYASRLFGVDAHIVVPEKSNPGKVASMEALGAKIITHGVNFDEAKLHCEYLAKEHGFRYIHGGNDPELIAGVATETLEMLKEVSEIDVVLVPVGGGSGLAGACIVAKALDSNIEVIGVQSEASPTAYQSWKQKKLLELPNRTFAEGLATGIAFELPQRILHELLDDFVLVKESEIRQAIVWMIEYAHTLAEGAGAAPLAAIYNMRKRLKDKTVGMICSGGNVSLQHLRDALDSVNI